MSTKRSYLSKVVVEMPDSGIKDFFDIANTMDGALSLGVGEPDFQTPEHVREAAVASIRRAETKYTDNRGTVELRAAAAEYLEKFDLHYDRADEILITMGASEGIWRCVRWWIRETRFWWLSLPMCPTSPAWNYAEEFRCQFRCRRRTGSV